jgi:membrane-associated phospholipid phosphatase
MQLKYWHLKQQARSSSGTVRGAAWYVQIILVLCALLFGIIVPVSRVILGYHTVEQVIVGSVLGFEVGVVWAAVFHSEAGCRTRSWLESCGLFSWFLQPDDLVKQKDS